MKHVSFGHLFPGFVLNARGRNVHEDSKELAYVNSLGPSYSANLFRIIEEGCKAVQSRLPHVSIRSKPVFIEDIQDIGTKDGLLYVVHLMPANNNFRKAIDTYLGNTIPDVFSYVGIDQGDKKLVERVLNSHKLHIEEKARPKVEGMLPVVYHK